MSDANGDETRQMTETTEKTTYEETVETEGDEKPEPEDDDESGT